MENVDFHNFLDRMRNPAAADLVRSIKSFIINFTSNPPNPEKDSNSVQEFMSSMEDMFKVHSLWAGATDEELDSAGEGLEKYLMTKLFNRAFAPLPEDAEHDQKISDKICLLQQFIRPEHLDIPPDFQNETSWLFSGHCGWCESLVFNVKDSYGWHSRGCNSLKERAYFCQIMLPCNMKEIL